MKALHSTNRRRVLAIAAALCAFAGALAITSGYGPGLDPDSMAYVGAASSLANGSGLRVPLGKWETRDSTVALTVWPPAFPVAMGLAQKLGAEPLTAARIVIALSAAASAALVVIVLAGAASLAACAIGVTVVLVTPSFVAVHLNALSEPLFLAAMMLTLYGMITRRPSVAAAGAAAAVMTRYAGVSAGAAEALWFLFLVGGTMRERIRRAVIAAAPAALAFVLWLAHNYRVAVVQSPIRIAYHPGLPETLRQGITSLMASVAPGAGGAAGFLAAVLLLVALGIALVRSKRSEPAGEANPDSRRRVIAATSVLLVVYLGVIVASRTFVGGSIQFDARILSPAILLAEIVIVSIVGAVVAGERRIFRYAVALGLAAWLVASVRVNGALVSDSIEDGNDFAASDWRESPTMEWVREHGSGRAIYTNWPAAIYFDANRTAFDIPTSASADTLSLFRKRFSDANGLLVAFDVRNFDYPPPDSLARASGLSLLKRFADGTVWGPKGSAAAF